MPIIDEKAIQVLKMNFLSLTCGIVKANLVLLVWNYASATVQGVTIDSVLKNYDTLTIQDLKHSIVRRSIPNGNSKDEHQRNLNFKALGRKFEIKLMPDTTIFSPSFKAVEDDGRSEKEIHVNQEKFYKGFLEGESESFVEAHFEDGLLTAQIATKENTYIIEPSWRHTNQKSDMIIYKTSDIVSNLSLYDIPKKSGKPSFCGVKLSHRSRRSADSQDAMAAKNFAPQERFRRAVPAKNTCPVVLVADYKFFQQMGQGRTSTTVNYMITVLQRTDKIFRNTVWSSGMTGIGFEVSEVRVHSKPSGSDGPAYNKYNPNPWNIDELLTAFSKSDWSKHCLAHLFTYQDFEKGVIGLAYVASQDHNEVGGICSRLYNSGGSGIRHLNCGLSSSLNWGRRLLTSEADIVTAHELGHNFGSDHDPDTTTCAPSESKEGKFIMYRTSVSGLRVNNKKFSPCSSAAIGKVLTSKSQLCFKAKQGAFCGNFEVEGSEDCDPGLDAVQKNNDPCCDSNCNFKTNAKCSDANSPCCENCSPAPTTKKCREEFLYACTGKTMCDGISASCPDAPKLTGPDCYGKGKCHNGECKSFCQTNGGKKNISCICTESADSCKLCCSDGIACSPLAVNGSNHNLDDGHPCDAGSYQGRCVQGKCEKTKQNVLDQFLSLLKNFTASKFAKFMQENIVGTIIVFSLLLWIPASCIVHFVDKRRDKEEEARMMWRDPKNTELIRKEGSLGRQKPQAGAPISPRKPMYKKPIPTPRLDSGPYYPSENIRSRGDPRPAPGYSGHIVSM